MATVLNKNAELARFLLVFHKIHSFVFFKNKIPRLEIRNGVFAFDS